MIKEEAIRIEEENERKEMARLKKREKVKIRNDFIDDFEEDFEDVFINKISSN